MIDLDDVRRAAGRISGRVARTPAIHSEAISRITGAEVWLKLDTLQATGAFKERGAANRLALLNEAERKAGVIAVSAGNHAQAVARHAALLGIASTIVMPQFTPATKVTRTSAWGASVVLHGASLAEAANEAYRLADAQGLTFIHPYDDDAVMAGQGTLALELFEDAPQLDTLAVPIGGGGLIAGCATVAAGLRPDALVFGVEASAYSAMYQRVNGLPVDVGGPTVAEGMAVRDVGERPLEVVRKLVRDILIVSEHAIEDAIALLAENAKVVAEGAGAAGLAAVLSHPDVFRGRKVGIPICGANIDNRVLANVLQRVMLRDGRMMRLVLDIPDRPGVLGEISMCIGDAGGNIIEVSHHRLFTSPSVQSARLEVMFEARDSQHSTAVLSALQERYVVTQL